MQAVEFWMIAVLRVMVLLSVLLNWTCVFLSLSLLLFLCSPYSLSSSLQWSVDLYSVILVIPIMDLVTYCLKPRQLQYLLIKLSVSSLPSMQRSFFSNLLLFIYINNACIILWLKTKTWRVQVKSLRQPSHPPNCFPLFRFLMCINLICELSDIILHICKHMCQ